VWPPKINKASNNYYNKVMKLTSRVPPNKLSECSDRGVGVLEKKGFD
jgi:hypothetical protein